MLVLESLMPTCCSTFWCPCANSHLCGTGCPVWAHFKACGEQDLDGFDDDQGNDDKEDDEPDDDDDDEDGADENDVWAEEGVAAPMEAEEELEGMHAHAPPLPRAAARALLLCSLLLARYCPRHVISSL